MLMAMRRVRRGDAAHEGSLARRLNARQIPSWRGLFRRLVLAVTLTGPVALRERWNGGHSD